jgi:hypothetical protein
MSTYCGLSDTCEVFGSGYSYSYSYSGYYYNYGYYNYSDNYGGGYYSGGSTDLGPAAKGWIIGIYILSIVTIFEIVAFTIYMQRKGKHQ